LQLIGCGFCRAFDAGDMTDVHEYKRDF